MTQYMVDYQLAPAKPAAFNCSATECPSPLELADPGSFHLSCRTRPLRRSKRSWRQCRQGDRAPSQRRRMPFRCAMRLARLLRAYCSLQCSPHT